MSKIHEYRGIRFYYDRSVKSYIFTDPTSGLEIIGGDIRQTKFSIDQIL